MRIFFHFLYLVYLIDFLIPSGRVDGLVAVVGNNAVLHSEVLQQAQIIAADQRIDPSKSPYLFEAIYSTSLENIIDQYTVLDLAEKDTNLIVSDEEVGRALDQRIESFILQAGSIELFEGAVGMSLRKIKLDYWPEIRNMMFIERYKFSKIQSIDVSRVEVNNFFSFYKDSIPPIPENYTYSLIEVPFLPGKISEDRIYNLLDALRNLVFEGASFDSLAIVYSQDPGSSSGGGRLGFTNRGELVRPYEEAAYALSIGELSLPVRSEFGYHLIKLIDKRGEKISTQHILLSVSFSKMDVDAALKKTLSIYHKSNNDPFVFDSLSVDYYNQYSNQSGVYVNASPNEIHYSILDNLYNLTEFKLSQPIEVDNSYILIYLYKHNLKTEPTPNNAWNLIYQYALQNKQNKVFKSFVNKTKEKTFIKYFQ